MTQWVRSGLIAVDVTQMRQFVDEMEIPHHEPLIFAGDFNVDNHSFAAEVANLVALLNATAPVQIGSQQYTSE